MSEQLNWWESELITKRSVNLHLLEIMARDFENLHHTITKDPNARRALLSTAQEYARTLLSKTPIFLSASYVLSEDGIIYNAMFFGELQTIRPTKFLDVATPLLSGTTPCQLWHHNGLGIVLEPFYDDGEINDDPAMDLHGAASLYSEVVVPLNGNIVFAGEIAVS